MEKQRKSIQDDAFETSKATIQINPLQVKLTENDFYFLKMREFELNRKLKVSIFLILDTLAGCNLLKK